MNIDNVNKLYLALSKDGKLRADLLRNPKRFIKDHLGRETEESMDIKPILNKKDVFYFVIPSDAKGLSNDELDKLHASRKTIVGCASTAGTAATASTASTVSGTVGSIGTGSSVGSIGTAADNS